MNWQSPEVTMQGDVYKMKCALKQGLRIIQLDIHRSPEKFIDEIFIALETSDLPVTYISSSGDFKL